jgi:hypothetical protein
MLAIKPATPCVEPIGCDTPIRKKATMDTPHELAPEQLRRTIDPQTLGIQTTEQVAPFERSAQTAGSTGGCASSWAICAPPLSLRQSYPPLEVSFTRT